MDSEQTFVEKVLAPKTFWLQPFRTFRKVLLEAPSHTNQGNIIPQWQLVLQKLLWPATKKNPCNFSVATVPLHTEEIKYCFHRVPHPSNKNNSSCTKQKRKHTAAVTIITIKSFKKIPQIQNIPLLTEEVRRELLAGLLACVLQILPSGWPNVSKTADSKGQMLAPHGTVTG